MRFRNTLIVMLLLLGLGAYVYFVEYPAARQESKKEHLCDFAVDDVVGLRLKFADRAIALEKSAGTWKLTEPVKADADEVAVKSLLRGVVESEVKRTVAEKPSDLSDFGLDAPLATVSMSVEGKAVPDIKVGKAAPVGYSAYVQRGSEGPVVLAGAGIRSAVDKKAKDLRDKKIVKVAGDEVEEIDVTTAASAVTLVKADGKWRIEQPASYPADDATVRSYMSTIRSLRAVDFPDDNATDLGAYGLDNPRLTVTLRMGGKKQEQLLFGSETDEKRVYLKRGAAAVVYAVSDWVYRDLDKGVKDFRDKTVLVFDQDQARALVVAHADGAEFKLVRGENKEWVLAHPRGKPVAYKISQYVNDVHDLKGYDVAAEAAADRKAFGLEPPAITISVRGEKDALLGKILLGRRGTGKETEYTGAAEGKATVFLLRDYVYRRLDKRLEDFIEEPANTEGATKDDTSKKE